jgi:hypothetical protein
VIQEEVPLKEDHSDNPFGRGAMKFDDYNYASSNPYILLGQSKLSDIKPAADRLELKSETLLVKLTQETLVQSQL